MKQKKIRLALIGCDGFSYGFLYDCTKGLPYELVAVSDTPDNMARFCARYAVQAQYEDYREMLAQAKPELVISFPAEARQYAVAADCLRAGAHVFSERPIAHTLEEAEALVALEKETGRSIVPRLNRRFTPSYRMAKEILSREEFGQPQMYLAKYHAGPYASEKVFLWNHVSHHFDLARYLLGEIQVTAADRVYKDEKRFGYNILFHTCDGCAGVIQTSSLQRGEYPVERVEITGNARNLMVDNLRTVEYSRPAPEKNVPEHMQLREGGDILTWRPNSAQLNNFTFYGFETCLSLIAEALLRGETPAPGMTDTIHTLRLVQALEDLVLPRP